MTPLNRTLALAEINRVAVLVGQYLHLDVARIDDRLFDINFAVAKCPLRLALCAFQRGLQLGPGVHQPHALAAAAGCGFQHDRIADLVRDPRRFFRRLQPARRARNKGDAWLSPCVGARASSSPSSPSPRLSGQ